MDHQIALSHPCGDAIFRSSMYSLFDSSKGSWALGPLFLERPTMLFWPPLLNWRGVSPRYAENSRLSVKAVPESSNAHKDSAPIDPMPSRAVSCVTQRV